MDSLKESRRDHMCKLACYSISESSMVVILPSNGEIYRKAFKIKHDVDDFNHFLKTNNLEDFVINHLVTNSNKNKYIRKVKNDKKHALAIAKIGKFENIKAYSNFDVSIFTLKSLYQDYYKLVDTRLTFKKMI